MIVCLTDPDKEQKNQQEKEACMPLVTLIIVLVVVGAALWAINSYIPMAKGVKTILNVVVVAILCLWLLQAFGVLGSINEIRVR
jgi:hydrogenase-4 membrane subunit HyfE